MFGGGAGNIADMIARMKENRPNSKKQIKKYRELSRTYKNSKIKYSKNEISEEEFKKIKSELKPYRFHQRNTFVLFFLIFIPFLGLFIWGIIKLLGINTY
jgi:hypothetical protein